MGRLKCGHNETWTMRLTDKGIKFAFCIGCMLEKSGIKDVHGREVPNTKPHYVSDIEKKVLVDTPVVKEAKAKTKKNDK